MNESNDKAAVCPCGKAGPFTPFQYCDSCGRQYQGRGHWGDIASDRRVDEYRERYVSDEPTHKLGDYGDPDDPEFRGGWN
jgi:hypothetical protein